MKDLMISLKKALLNPILILQIGAGICFIGHGMLAISGKIQFVALLQTFGFHEEGALTILKAIGALDVIIGLLLIVRPTKVILIWAVLWTMLTIAAWGIHGDSMMDLFRRITYTTTPLAMLILLYRNKADEKSPIKKKENITFDFSKSEQAIEEFDLSLISMKLMDASEGEGWSEQQCIEVAQEYRRYLKLKLFYPSENIVPNRAIDTMWHYHILDTAAYQKDCNSIFGDILHHYPYFGMNGVSDQRNLFNSFDKTKMLYEKTFSTPMCGPTFLPSFQRAS